MAVMTGNGGVLPKDDDDKVENNYNKTKGGGEDDDDILKGVIKHLIEGLDTKSQKWINKSLLLKMEAARRDLLVWARQGGSPFRPVLLLSAGIVTVLALTGVLVFMLFFVAATVNAIVISLLISLVAIGGFLAIFFACFTVMYIGVLFVAAFATFTITILSIIAVLFTAGWIGFFWIMWLGLSKGVSLAKRYISNPSTSDTSCHDSSKESADQIN
uniref:uncharacterized protein LOC122578716 n=1 Tax=Erigeron canadensis TaxID=72917 RepID=UPI001CB9CFA3|nr:uncharacterized protein LOC122578716 [Erigeron canadensis]